jgi:hypothetical protein
MITSKNCYEYLCEIATGETRVGSKQRGGREIKRAVD